MSRADDLAPAAAADPVAAPASTDYQPPFQDTDRLRRRELAGYLHRLGRGLAVRFDVPALSLEDVKWAATVFSDLAQELNALAYEDTRADIWRVLAARYAMEQVRHRLARQVVRAPHTGTRDELLKKKSRGKKRSRDGM
jgi:hypothetical protein